MSKHESLYEEANFKDEIMEKRKEDFYSKVCTFRPRINPPPREIAERIQQVDYHERGQQLLTKREESKRESQRVVRKDPEIGKKNSKRPPHMEIHEYLYGYKDKQKKEKDELKQAQEKEIELKRSATKNKNSDKILWENMDQKLLPLFQTFDVDGDGHITNSDIESVVLNNDLKMLMAPLFNEAKLGTINLEQNDFIEACKDLIRVAYA